MSTDLTKEFLSEIRQNLEQQRADLINKGHVVRSDMREREKVPRDSIDESTDEQDTSTLLRLKDRERNLIAKINEAIERIDDGDYGYCEVCGEEIGVRRLRARPMATMCIDCKEDQESEERRRKAVNPGIFSEFE